MDKKTSLQRIKEFIDFKGISIRAFEQSIGMSNGSFASQLKNGKSIGIDKLENILHIYPMLSSDWVLTGKGNMLHNSEEKIVSESHPVANETLLMQILKEKDKEIRSLNRTIGQLSERLRKFETASKVEKSISSARIAGAEDYAELLE
jgi:DNA transposition AAA+ family ATPase